MRRRPTRISIPVVAAAVALTAGCVEVRDRPLPFEPDQPPDLSVEVVSPHADRQQLIAGREVQVAIRAGEPDGRLVGVGYVLHRSFQDEILASDDAFFDARADTMVTFSVRIPEDLRTNTQVEFVGVAHGPDDVRELSRPAVLIVIQCSPNSVFCS